MNVYRDNGAIGAILDEYERANQELAAVIDTLSDEALMEIVDSITDDEDCRSVQTILTHVIRAGYGYVDYIRRDLGEDAPRKEGVLLTTIDGYQSALKQMFEYNVELFKDYPNIKLEEHDLNKKIHVSWGQHFDVEQLMEHAIVHILRHRRQIERFKLKMGWG